jgi:glutamate/tyrosine decarboxylase-like PLP-dependent enzyme
VSADRELLRRTADIAADFLDGLDERPVWPEVSVEELRNSLGGSVPDGPAEPLDVIERLAADAQRGIVASQSGRYYGFVTGGSLPAAMAADWLTSAWDQNLAFAVMSPAAAVIEETAGRWVGELLGIPPTASFAFVTGTQLAHVTSLAAARQHVLGELGWDVVEDGLARAPPITVVAGAMRHVTVDRALRFLGIGRRQLVVVEADDQGRMRADALATALARLERPLIVCAQAGEVNTGASDPFAEIVEQAREAGAWVHVDGAFGLWAAASPAFAELVTGHGDADSWAVDAHKWLNVPYDCGIAFCAHPGAQRSAMSMQAAYLGDAPADAIRDPADWTPDSSRRARSIPVYAAIRQLGRSGVAELVELSSAHARAAAEGLARLRGCQIVNEVVLNQVLVRFGDDETTRSVLARVQAGGEAWMGGTTWEGRAAIRISVSGWRTSLDDITRTVAAFGRALDAR